MKINKVTISTMAYKIFIDVEIVEITDADFQRDQKSTSFYRINHVLKI